ncbi:MAG: SHOCT domain-containing protein [Deltaproteobacteria bacterium]|nr:SHOCT domain-containing protein [Deltaproteobacteria bacterium]
MLSLLVWGLLIAGLIYVGIRVTRSLGSGNHTPYRDMHDSLEIAKQRFAKGDITEEEYTRMKKVLLQ